jgi:hypothetical protein
VRRLSQQVVTLEEELDHEIQKRRLRERDLQLASDRILDLEQTLETAARAVEIVNSSSKESESSKCPSLILALELI